MQKIGIFYNPALFKTLRNLNEKVEILINNGCKVYLLESQKRHGLEAITYDEKFTNGRIDLLMVFGGDGTILRASKLVLTEDIPLLGFNHGKLGFLSECEKNDFKPVLHKVLNDDFQIEERMVIKSLLSSSHSPLFALNDCVLHKGKFPRMLTFSLFRNNDFLFDFKCDGIIVSTPTGSTAYNISAGGSIAFPHTDVILITPINPHNQYIKPLILSADDSYQISLKNGNEKAFLIIDGEEQGSVKINESITICKALHPSLFVKISEKSFAHILREKFFI